MALRSEEEFDITPSVHREQYHLPAAINVHVETPVDYRKLLRGKDQARNDGPCLNPKQNQSPHVLSPGLRRAQWK